jgi:hypothetical protein
MAEMMTRVGRTAADGETAVMPERLSSEELRTIDAYWRACNYLAAGMIYLRGNPLLREPLKPEHVKRRLLGHWGSSPGLSFAYVHLNRLITSTTSTPSSSPGPATARRACWRRSSGPPPRSTPSARIGSCSGTAVQAGSRRRRSERGPTGWCSVCGPSPGPCCCSRADIFSGLFAARWLGLEPAAGRYFLLGAASLSAVGYEHDRSDPVIRFWNERPHERRGGAVPMRTDREEARR